MTVIAGVDGGTRAAATLRAAAEEARYRQVALLAVTAVPERAPGAPGGRPYATYRTVEEERAAAESVLRETVADTLGELAGAAQVRAVVGSPGRVLLGLARTLNAQLIVLAAGTSGATSRLLGGASQHVLRSAPCPVLVVPGPAAERWQ